MRGIQRWACFAPPALLLVSPSPPPSSLLCAGRGTYQWPSGASYIGDWYENKMHGVGAFLASSGDRYQGVFQNDRFQNAQGHWIAPSSN